jgi:hypothetical protein
MVMNPDQPMAIPKQQAYVSMTHLTNHSSLRWSVMFQLVYPMNHIVMAPLARPLVICKRQQPTLGACK